MDDTPETLPPYQWEADTIKGSERFFDLLKGEQDRLSNKLRTGDERARSNGTAALAAVGMVTLLRGVIPTLPGWLLLIFLSLVLTVLGLMAAIIFNRDTTSMKPSGLWKERTDLWEDGRSYMEIMQFYQAGFIENIAEMDRLQRTKYRLLDVQNVVVIALLSTLAVMLLWAVTALN